MYFEEPNSGNHAFSYLTALSSRRVQWLKGIRGAFKIAEVPPYEGRQPLSARGRRTSETATPPAVISLDRVWDLTPTNGLKNRSGR